MIEPRAWQQCSACKRYGDLHCGACTPLTTVADVLADLRKAITYPDGSITRVIILEFLDAWEKENAK